MAAQAQVGIITEPTGTMHVPGYLQILAELPEVATVAVVSGGDETTAMRARETLGKKLHRVYPDTAALLEDFRPVLTIVSLEPRTSPPAIGACLEQGSHVLAEKPACLRWEEFAETAQRHERNLGLAFAARGFPFVWDAKRLVSEGALGTLYGVDTYFIADQARVQRPAWQASWFAQKARAGGGHLMWLGIHYIDLLQHITGQRIVEVAGFTTVVGGAPIDTEDAAVVALRFAGGMVGTLTSAYYLDRDKQSHLHLWGERGWLRGRPNDWEDLEWYSTLPRHRTAPSRRIVYHGFQSSTYYGLVRSAVRAALGEEPHPITAAESLSVLQVIHAVYRAAETGQSQRVAP